MCLQYQVVYIEYVWQIFETIFPWLHVACHVSGVFFLFLLGHRINIVVVYTCYGLGFAMVYIYQGIIYHRSVRKYRDPFGTKLEKKNVAYI